jgi:hypothetical protein
MEKAGSPCKRAKCARHVIRMAVENVKIAAALEDLMPPAIRPLPQQIDDFLLSVDDFQPV